MTSPGFAPIAAGTRIDTLLRHAPLDPLEMRILLGHALHLTRVQLITQSERQLTAMEAAALTALLRRRQAGEPIAYLVGTREFFGLAFDVTPAVLIPRPETELLVDLALQRAAQGARVLDLGTGSGAIAVALAHARP
ncbi:MAG: peptide chain release factor N(5)-glutamine methyltransferase, partial [Burkholderiaceae bacterium]